MQKQEGRQASKSRFRQVVSRSYSQVVVVSCRAPLLFFPCRLSFIHTAVTLRDVFCLRNRLAPIIILIVIVISVCISFQRRRSSIPFRRCVPRTHSLEVEVRAREPEAVAASSAGARVLRAPTEFRGCARGVRGGCPRSVQRGGEHLPVWWVSKCSILQFSNGCRTGETYVA